MCVQIILLVTSMCVSLLLASLLCLTLPGRLQLCSDLLPMGALLSSPHLSPSHLQCVPAAG